MPKKRRLREEDVERRLVKKVKEELGGIAYKFTSPARRSVPDRLVLLPVWKTDPPTRRRDSHECVVFVECKAPGEKPTPNQEREHRKLRELGHRVEVVDRYESVDQLIEALRW